MTESSFDYFHFTYEGISESDESESRRGSCRDEEEERENCAVNGYSLGANQRISPGSAASEFVKAVIKMNWVVAKV
jgi:hypothetical protein